MILVSKTKKKIVTYVGVVLDASGSMLRAKTETIDSFNEQLQELVKSTKDGMETYITASTFNTEVNMFAENKRVQDVGQLTDALYKPDGMTAMLDAVGDMLTFMGPTTKHEDEDVAYLLVVISDGMENASQRYSWEQIAEMIQERKKSKVWTITYIGANQDLSELSRRLKIDSGNMATYSTNSAAAYKAGFSKTTASLGKFMGARGMAGTVGPSGICGMSVQCTTSFYDEDDGGKKK